MPLKRQLTHLEEDKKLVKLKKIEVTNKTLIENISFLFKDGFTKGSCVFENSILYHKNFDKKEDSKTEDDVEMTDNDEEVLDKDTFTKLLKVAQDTNNFESHKTLFLCGSHFSI